MTNVLVLNQDYQAISLCDVNRALVLVLMKKAEMVTDVESRRIRSVNREFQFPSIIRLYQYVNLPYQKVRLTRHNIFKRDGNKCVYCGNTERLTIDHLIPRADGGRTTWDNLVTACEKCNAQKGKMSVEQAGFSLDYQPFRPSFIMFLSNFSKVNEDWKPFLMMT